MLMATARPFKRLARVRTRRRRSRNNHPSLCLCVSGFSVLPGHTYFRNSQRMMLSTMLMRIEVVIGK